MKSFFHVSVVMMIVVMVVEVIVMIEMAVVLGWYGRGRRFGFARHGLSLNCFASVLLFGFAF